MTLDAKIEAILYFKGEPVSVAKLAEILETNSAEIEAGIKELEIKLSLRGLSLVRKDDEVMLGTNPLMSPLIEKLIKESLNRDLGKAGLETLSIVLYRGPVTRRDVDYIRGVNSTFILRELLIRGLIERLPEKEGSRSFFYGPSMELLQFMGISKKEELPEYERVQRELHTFERESKESPKEDAAQ